MTTVHDEAHGLTLQDRLRDGAIDHFGRFGFEQSLVELSFALDVDVSTLSDLFGSANGLRAACDAYVLSALRIAKTQALSCRDPSTGFAQLAQIESFAPVVSYLMRSLDAGDELGHTLMRELIDDAETYLETAVADGTVKPSRDPRARARFLAMFGGGGFLLYLHLHDTPLDMRAVLRDYARDMILPALELYTHGLMADDTMYEAFLAQGRG